MQVTAFRLCVCVWEQPVCVCLPHPSPFSFILQGLCCMGSNQMSSGQSGTHVSWYWPWGPSTNKVTKFSHRSKPWFYMWENRKNIFWSGKRFYVIMHLSGLSTYRKILHYICIYLKGHMCSLKSKNVLIAWKIVPQMFLLLLLFFNRWGKVIQVWHFF